MKAANFPNRLLKNAALLPQGHRRLVFLRRWCLGGVFPAPGPPPPPRKTSTGFLIRRIGCPRNFVAQAWEKHSFADKCVPKCNLGTREFCGSWQQHFSGSRRPAVDGYHSGFGISLFKELI
jgi:hypothetical protein